MKSLIVPLFKDLEVFSHSTKRAGFRSRSLKSRARKVVPILLVLLTGVFQTLAQTVEESEFQGDYFPTVSRASGAHEIALGPIGGVMTVPYGKKEALVSKLWQNGPGAKSGLKVGDVIVRVGRKRFKKYSGSVGGPPTGAPEAIGNALIEAQEEDRPLKLTVIRDGEEEEVEVDLPPLPEFSRTFPKDCKRSDAFLKASYARLAADQRSSGMWPSNEYSSAWCALALLSSGDSQYLPHVKKAAAAFGSTFDAGEDPSDEEFIRGSHSSNWKVCMAGIFLAEYQLATGDQSYARALRHCSLRLEHRIQEKTGRYGHHHGPKRIPYGGKGLVIINVHAHLMWALSSHTREISSWDTWELSYEQVLRSMSSKKDGAVGYNHSARGGGQSSCRTGGMATALELVGRNGTDQRYMGRWLKAHTQHFPNTHAMTSLGPMFGFMGLKNTNKPAHRKALDEYRWMFALLTPANFSHGSYYYGQRGNYGGDGYCNYRLVANWMNTIIIGSQRSDTLWMFGNRKKGWFSGDTKTAN